MHANLVREKLDREDSGWIVCVRGDDWEANDVVKTAVEEARKLVGGRPKGKTTSEGFWEGFGICTWESIKIHSE